MKLQNRLVLLAILLTFVFGIVGFVERYVRKNYPLAVVENLRVAYYKNQEKVFTNEIPLPVSRLAACGELHVPHPQSLIIGILDVNSNEYVGHNDATEVIPPGSFCVNLLLDTAYIQSGNYRLEVMDRHEVIAEKLFVVK